MKILVIKQTSLGDVLHATGHVRTIKERYPEAHLTLLTADTSLEIFQRNPYVDEFISFQRYRIKSDWWKHPLWSIHHFKATFKAVRERHYDLALDLQGRWKSVIFLYAARATRRFVKGRWPFLRGFRNKQLHALTEMDRVLQLADIPVKDSHMEFFTSEDATQRGRRIIENAGWNGKDYIVVSPFTRWPSKNWHVEGYAELVKQLASDFQVVVTGAGSDRHHADAFVQCYDLERVTNACGLLDLEEFAAVVRNARAVVSGDSFAMHLAVACDTPVVALFGPTAESRVGPKGSKSISLRADVGCEKCYRRDCTRRCIDDISVDDVLHAIKTLVVQGSAGPEASGEQHQQGKELQSPQ